MNYNNEKRKLNASLQLRYNAWKRIENYGGHSCITDDNGETVCTTSSEDKADEATAEGTPAWYIINAHINYEVMPNLQFSVSLENLLDRHYIPFASGVSGAGRSFSISLRAKL